ncbi:oxygen-independent coproporphyrinogen III oxidase [Piscinibacter sakaiensis]|nr:oxygen-independent coproporphyrinogen III oxidase [Piscinibacter sakaiensis]
MSTLLAAAAPVRRIAVPDDALLRRMDRPGPRYTSYPTADRFVEAWGPADYAQSLAARAQGVLSAGATAPLSIYVHLPFCESVCYYCACNKIITRHHDRAAPYLAALEQEIALHVGVLGRGQPVSQLHFGGGSPTFLSDEELGRLMGTLRSAFTLLPHAEVAIEVDPRTVDAARLRRLASLGFNRISFGVQDLDPEVQRAVHRVQDEAMIAGLMREARALGFRSTNVDLIYGLPKQTVDSVRHTVEAVAALRPDRVALYAYAHLPQRFKPQRRIDEQALPDGEARVRMLAAAIEAFLDAGYEYIGMDHFALPNDALAVAKRQGRLHRNFQGYSTQPESDLIGLGVSAIGGMGASYSQNAKTLPEYYDALRQGQFPVARGLSLTRDDVLRRAVIMALMCQGRVDFEAFALAHLVELPHYFAAELARLAPLAEAGLVCVDASGIELTPLGWYLVRAVAMVFDRHARADERRAHFSRII